MVKRNDVAAKRSEVLSVRLDPRLKYLAELGARSHRRTLSGFVEWAVEDALAKVFVEHKGKQASLIEADCQHELWDVDEADRLVRLALHYPNLLTHEEQVMWKAIRETGAFWRGRAEGRRGASPADEQAVRYDRLRAQWEDIRALGRGELTPEDLAERATKL